jgi:uncharacterized protein YkwD
MTQTQKAGRRRLIVAAVLAAVGIAVLAAVAIAARPGASAVGAGSGTSACPTAAEPVAESTAQELRKSVRCLINEERAIRGLSKVVRHKSLEKAAQKHSKTMVETDCLAHRCPGEVDLETRVRRAGYFAGAEEWQYAENTGCAVSAEAMVTNWMAKQFHRANILEPKFRHVGVGVTQRPVKDRCDSGYATFAAVVGWREPGN